MHNLSATSPEPLNAGCTGTCEALDPPSFIGDVLPSHRVINDDDGFEATWESAAQRLTSVTSGYAIPLEISGAPTVGVRFVDPVGHYTVS